MPREKVFVAISPECREIIIDNINNGLLESSVNTGIKDKWWKNKHNPNKPIPTQIYSLGNGTKDELLYKYKIFYGDICNKKFQDYFRELIKQKIMI